MTTATKGYYKLDADLTYSFRVDKDAVAGLFARHQSDEPGDPLRNISAAGRRPGKGDVPSWLACEEASRTPPLDRRDFARNFHGSRGIARQLPQETTTKSAKRTSPGPVAPPPGAGTPSPYPLDRVYPRTE